MSSTLASPNPTRRWITLAFWGLTASAFLALFLLDTRQDYSQLLEACEVTECHEMAISSAEVGVLESWGLSTMAYAAFMAGAPAITVTVYWLLGGLILWRQGDTPIGLTVSLTLLALPIAAISDPNSLYTNFPALLFPSIILQSLGSVFVLLFFYLFPNGRFYPKLAFIPMAGAILVIAVSDVLEISEVGPLQEESPLFFLLILLIVLGLIFQVLRYRRDSTALERQQTKWILFGFSGLILGFPVWGLIFGGLLEMPPGVPRLLAMLGGWIANQLLFMILPFSIAIAILRYRLWDIDVIIRRTLVYSLLTAILAGLYFGTVTLLQNLLSSLTGQRSPLAIVLSTLAIAALFGPLRRSIQDMIDRRFYRRRYNAEKALAAFSLRVRDEVDLENLSRALLRIVDETMQPASSSIWLRELPKTGQSRRIPA